ncbi:disks large-associated protein 5-like [Homarus americanus]|uniref:disks large-associated protein 5-like n=1 Tax=Homarus americanus TaxID=6706 RepID=UPI001C44D89C|nr:disks large-associated protein 5-like [Homarus americanus]
MGVDTELNVAHFRVVLEGETHSLRNYCFKWKKNLKANSDVPEDIEGDIMVAIGQAELLIKERFNQFNGLIDDCEFKRGEKETTCLDLQGFWDIVYLQVEKVIKKFNSLEKLKNNGWKEVQHSPPPVIHKKKLLSTPNKPCVTKPRKGNSDLRAHILAARKKMQAKSENAEKDSKTLFKESDQNKYSIAIENCQLRGATDIKPRKTAVTLKKTSLSGQDKKRTEKAETSVFDAGFFKIETPTKKNVSEKHFTPGKVDQKVLASTVLKERVRGSSVIHKDYSPCMRVTRSMKAKNIRSKKLNL